MATPLAPVYPKASSLALAIEGCVGFYSPALPCFKRAGGMKTKKRLESVLFVQDAFVTACGHTPARPLPGNRRDGVHD